MASILVVDDEPELRAAFSTFFERQGHHTFQAGTVSEGVALYRRVQPELVLLDLHLPDGSGFDVLERLAEEEPVVIMVTGHGDVPLAVKAMQMGAENFLTKPVELAHLGAASERAIEKALLRRMSRYLAGQRSAEASSLLGSSPAMRELSKQVELLARSDRTTGLIQGEIGTGKGRVAELIHTNSPRADRQFVEVNCAALTADSLDSELFGQERGGDAAIKRGLFEVADGGTLFLDEIGDLAPHLQPKLLRVLEGKGFRRVGGTDEVAADVRLIAATSKDLASGVTAGTFREDLYYRLSVMPIHLPPLRARAREDLVELIGHLLRELGGQLRDAPARLSDAALDRLLRYAWPGNIRELRNVIERAMIMARGADAIGVEQLPAEVREATGAGVERHVARSLADVERAHIERTLVAHAANRTRAARELGISRATLIKKIKEYRLAPTP